MALPTTSVPAHVPPDLVKFFDFRTGLGDRPHEVIGKLHEGPPIFYSPRHHHAEHGAGTWIPTRAADIRRILQDPATFSSKGVTARTKEVGRWSLIPLELDPPDHTKFRTLLNPLFSPSRVIAMMETMRARAVALIDDLLESDSCDFIEDFAQKFPTAIFVDLMGLPSDETKQFIIWEHAMLGGDPTAKMEATKAVIQYLKDLMTIRRKQPRDDVISFVVSAKIDGRPLTDDELIGIGYLLFIGGLDTVASSLGWHFRHLAEHPANQSRLRSEPRLVPNAVEELLRAYAVVNPSRFATQDVDVAGVTIKKGDNVTCSTILAGRDPAVFDNPTVVNLERTSHRHDSFSAGPHRCIGAHLARRELAIAFEEWLQRVPEFHVVPGAKVTAHGGGVVGLDSLPLMWQH